MGFVVPEKEDKDTSSGGEDRVDSGFAECGGGGIEAGLKTNGKA
jgi:hypothetical protein